LLIRTQRRSAHAIGIEADERVERRRRGATRQQRVSQCLGAQVSGPDGRRCLRDTELERRH
jgi:hypothetical protein